MLPSDCTSRNVEFEGEVLCESHPTRLQRFRGKVNGSWKPWKFFSQLRIAAESGERVPITSYISVPTTRSVCVSDWRSVGRAICRRSDVDDHPLPRSKGMRGEC